MKGFRDQDNGAFTWHPHEHFYEGDDLVIPCRKCIGCLANRCAEWALRAEHELRYHDKAAFLMLSYRDAALRDDRSLVHRHWQLFAKRLREAMGPFRYLMCGEYGPGTDRPHYHALVMGLDFTDDQYPIHNGLFQSPACDDLWGHGYVHIGSETSGASANYIAGYVTGKLHDQVNARKTRKYQKLGIQAPYIRMSTNPGLGKAFYDEFKHELFAGQGSIRLGKNYFAAVPRYYKKLYQDEFPLAFDAYQARATLAGELHSKDDATLERIETVKLIKLKSTPRDNFDNHD